MLGFLLHKHEAQPGADICCSLVPFLAAGPSPHEDFTLLQLRPARDRLLPGPQASACQQGLRDRVPGAGRALQPGAGPGPQLHRHHRALGRARHLHRENTQLTGPALGPFLLGQPGKAPQPHRSKRGQGMELQDSLCFKLSDEFLDVNIKERDCRVLIKKNGSDDGGSK